MSRTKYEVTVRELHQETVKRAFVLVATEGLSCAEASALAIKKAMVKLFKKGAYFRQDTSVMVKPGRIGQVWRQFQGSATSVTDRVIVRVGPVREGGAGP